ncbi:hypothetical protein Ancab_032745 [Ancistrocladus abbreviatus]
MEAFSLLKYWKGGGGGNAGELSSTTRSCGSTTTTIVTAVSNPDTDTDDDDDESDGDGPFFDLEFTVPGEEVEGAEGEGEKSVKTENAGGEVVQLLQEVVEVEENDDVESNATTDGDREELKFTLSSGSSSCERTADLNISLSPSDDLFFKGRLLPVDPASEVMNSRASSQRAVSLLKSATKLRVLMSGLKKSKLQQPSLQKQINQSEENQQQPQEKKQNQNQNDNSRSSKSFTAKFKIEGVPIVSLFTRDNSSRASNVEDSSNKQPTQTQQQQQQQQKQSGEEESASSSHSKDGMQKYLKKVKPLYIRVSKRYGDRLRFSGQLSLSSASKTTAAFAKGEAEAAELKEEAAAAAEVGNGGGDGRSQNHKQGNLAVGFRVMSKHLGKSKSASSVVHSMPMQSRRRDDSLLQQQDGIQSAILHCKRSFNGSREAESSVLSRSSSDPSHEKSKDLSMSMTVTNASALGAGGDVVADVARENAARQA